jgi:two-component system, LytTR family, sensor kinase
MNAIFSGKRSEGWVGISAMWVGVGIIDACQTVFPMRAQGMHHAWVALFATLTVAWLPWALASPMLMNLTSRYPAIRTPTARGLLPHAGMLAAVSVVYAAWSALLEFWLNPWAEPSPRDPYMRLFLAKLLYGILTSLVAYMLIVMISEFMASRDRLARSHTEAADLRAQLSEARLAALRQQMDPHFIFNALNSVCGLVRDSQSEAAVQALVALSELLRKTAEQSHRPLVTLAEDVSYLQSYLEIQKYRFGERLQVTVDVPAELLSAVVPNLLLQPLAENAIKHGIEMRASGGAVQVTGSLAGDRLLLSIRNNTPNANAVPVADGARIGLSNLRTRMSLLYGKDCDLTMERAENGDVEVRVSLPMRKDFISVRA